MNRTIYWSQEQLRSYDLLWFEKDVLAALGGLEVDVAGATTTVVGGAGATQTVSPSLTINLAAARIYQQAAMDSSSFGALGADATTIQQSGFAAAQQIALSTSGIAAGQSRWSLVQAQFSQVDSVRAGDPTNGVLYYYNSSNPSAPFQGPANSATPNNTVRSGVMVYSVVTGAAATTGSEVPPSPISGWVPLYLIDLSFGQTTIINSQILTAGPSVGTGVPNNYPGAPILAGLLNSHHSGLAGNAPKIKLTSEVQGILPLVNLPASSAPAGGGLSTVQSFAGNPNGSVAGNTGVAGVSAPDLVWNTSALTWWVCTVTGNAATATWVVFSSSGSPSAIILFEGPDTGTANAYVVATPTSGTPAFPTSLFTGLMVQFKVAHTNTASSTFTFAGLATKSITYNDGTALGSGDWPAGSSILLCYDGTAFQCLTITQQCLSREIAAAKTAPQVTVLTKSSTSPYTPPAGALYLVVEAVAAGGSGSANTVAGNAGGNTTFGTSFLTCNGGSAGPAGNGTPGLGGIATGGDINWAGGQSSLVFYPASADYGGGGGGQAGGSIAGPAGPQTGSPSGNNGIAGGTGSGGSGAALNAGTFPSQGGGAGGALKKTITSILSSYAFSVGAGGAAVTSTKTSGTGGDGLIVVTAYFQ